MEKLTVNIKIGLTERIRISCFISAYRSHEQLEDTTYADKKLRRLSRRRHNFNYSNCNFLTVAFYPTAQKEANHFWVYL